MLCEHFGGYKSINRIPLPLWVSVRCEGGILLLMSIAIVLRLFDSCIALTSILLF